MLIGKASDLNKNPYVDARVLELVKKTIELAKTQPDGKYSLDGDKVFVNLVSTSTFPTETRQSEIHKDFADIQILLEGCEVFGVSSYAPQDLQEQEMKNDVCFIPGIEKESFLTLYPNDFVLFYPGEAHRPQCSQDGQEHDIRKAVVKIPKEWF